MEDRENMVELEMLKNEINAIRKEYRKLQRRYIALYEYIPDLCISIDEQLNIVDCNRTYAYFMGYIQEELVGKPVCQYLADESRLMLREICDEHEKNHEGTLYGLKFQFIRKDGKVLEVSGDIEITYLQDKKIYQGKLHFGDVSETKRLKEELHNKRYLLNTILKTINEGVLIISTQYKIQFMNEYLTRTWGNQVGRPCYEVFYDRKVKCTEDICPIDQIMQGNVSYHRLYKKSHKGDLFEFTAYSFQNIDHTRSVLMVVKDTTENRKLKEELREYKYIYLEELQKRYHLDNIVGKSKKMQEIYDLVLSVAQTQCTVLIQGESGTGKELIARAIHYNSPHRNNPFVAVCCSVFSTNLLESELFGHVKGAFTGAIRNKPGRFELAHGGTIFLDEIGDVSLAIQAKLLRVLQEKEFERVGGEKKIKVDLRVVAATNKDLEKEVKEGRFREDLYYRLTIIPIFLPPLREKIEDIPLLVDHLMAKYRQILKKDIQAVSPDAMGMLLNYPWPGNVRELEGALEYAFVRCTGDILHPADFPERILKEKESPEKFDGNGSKGINGVIRAKNRRVELPRELIAATIQEAKGNRTDAARILEVSRTTLWRLMKRYGLL